MYIRTTLPFFVSFFIQFVVIRLSHKRAFCIDHVETDKPQRLHLLSTSRAGGLGVFVASVIALTFLGREGFFIALSALPVFLAGFYEDLKTNINPKLRLSIIAVGSVIGILLMDSVIQDIGFLTLPLFLAIPFTIFAVTGVSNSINIIDGINGLASGVSIITLVFLGAVSYIQGDQLILNISIILLAATIGFFVWNFPKGKVFLGDGGAYFVGFLLAEISVLLVARNPAISPWFPLVILAYPIFEVFFSIYRRIKKRVSALGADKIHLHTLIYKRIAKRSSKTSVYIWALITVFNVAAFLFRSNSLMLLFVFLGFSSTYIYLYRRIVRFKGSNLPVKGKRADFFLNAMERIKAEKIRAWESGELEEGMGLREDKRKKQRIRKRPG